MCSGAGTWINGSLNGTWGVECVKKKYLKTRPVCKVTFELPKAAVADAKKVSLVGDFTDWRREKGVSLKRQKDGRFAVTIELAVGRAYRFRYLIDGERWENDWAADRYEPAKVGTAENSVVEV
jgi:1,4-alpha-glucan branching enzyme